MLLAQCRIRVLANSRKYQAVEDKEIVLWKWIEKWNGYVDKNVWSWKEETSGYGKKIVRKFI